MDNASASTLFEAAKPTVILADWSKLDSETLNANAQKVVSAQPVDVRRKNESLRTRQKQVRGLCRILENQANEGRAVLTRVPNKPQEQMPYQFQAIYPQLHTVFLEKEGGRR